MGVISHLLNDFPIVLAILEYQIQDHGVRLQLLDGTQCLRHLGIGMDGKARSDQLVAQQLGQVQVIPDDDDLSFFTAIAGADVSIGLDSLDSTLECGR